MMTVYINGEPQEFAKDITLQQALEQYGAREPFVAALNANCVWKSDYAVIELSDGDRIDVVQPTQGG